MAELTIPVWDSASSSPLLERGKIFIDALSQMGVGVRGQSVVDLGTGYGPLALAVASAGADRVLAVDVNPERVQAVADRGRASGVEIDTRVKNLLDPIWDFPASDVALMIGVVEYAGLWDETESVHELQIKVVTTAHAALRPGGVLVLGTKNRLWPRYLVRDVHTRQPFVNFLPRAMATAVSKRLSGKPYRHHIHSPKGWASVLQEAGFVNVRVYFPYLSYQVPLLVTSSPKLGDVGAIMADPSLKEAAEKRFGRLWRVKAYGMSVAGSLGLPLFPTVMVVAERPE